MRILTSLALFIGLGIWQQESSTPAAHITSDLMRKDSRLYLNYQTGEQLEAVIQSPGRFQGTLGSYVVSKSMAPETGPGLPSKLSGVELLEERVLNSDAVVIGVPTRSVAAITSTDDFAFTDFEVRLDKVLSNSSNKLLTSSQQIVVTQPGGQIYVAGQPVTALDPEFPLLEIGKEYVLFLHTNSDSGSYSIAAQDVFRWKEDSVSAGRVHSRVLAGPVPSAVFMHNLDQAISARAAANEAR